MLKDMVNYPFGGGMSSITSGSGGPPSTDIYRRIVSGHFEIRQKRRPRTVSFYVPLSKRTRHGLTHRVFVSFADAKLTAPCFTQVGEASSKAPGTRELQTEILPLDSR